MKKVIVSEKNAAALGPYSAGLDLGDLVFLSGQLGINQAGEMVSNDVVEQAEQVFVNIKNLLDGEGLSFDQVVKTTVFVKDMGDFAKVNEVYAKYFKEPYPVRSCIEVARLPKDGLVEIECIVKK